MPDRQRKASAPSRTDTVSLLIDEAVDLASLRRRALISLTIGAEQVLLIENAARAALLQRGFANVIVKVQEAPGSPRLLAVQTEKTPA